MVAQESPVAQLQLDWLKTPYPESLADQQIHLWLLRSAELEPEYRDCLNAREVERSERIIDLPKRDLYVAGRAGLRILLGHYAGIDPADVRMRYGVRGKPSFIGGEGQDIEFNYTVSNGYALFAFSRSMPLGVDLEIFPRNIEAELFARRILSTVEKETWNKVAASQQTHAMLACWTRKEAYGKLLGVGIRYNMNEADLFVETENPHWISPVTGLFEDDPEQPLEIAHGVQLKLPVPGAAALMYGRNNDYNPMGGAEYPATPSIRAFEYGTQTEYVS